MVTTRNTAIADAVQTPSIERCPSQKCSAMRRCDRCPPCGLVGMSWFSHGPGPHRGHSEDRGQESEVEADCGEGWNNPMVLSTSSCCSWSDPQGLQCLEHEGLTPKLESLFIPLVVFDYGTLVPLASSHFYFNALHGILDKLM